MTVVAVPLPDWLRATILLDPFNVWGNLTGMGLGELIACFSPAKRFDKRGSLIFIDDFEDGLSKVNVATDGTGGDYILSCAESRSGVFSLKLTSGEDSDRYAKATWYLHTPIFSRMGIESHFRIVSNVRYVYLSFLVFDGTEAHEGTVRHNAIGQKWEYKNSAGTYTDLETGIICNIAANLFHPAKLVLDLDNDKYHRLVIADQEIDMSAIDLFVETDTSQPRIDIYVSVESDSGYNGVAYIDNLIVTQGEPPNEA